MIHIILIIIIIMESDSIPCEQDQLRKLLSHPRTKFDLSSQLPMGKLTNVFIDENEYMHRNIFLNSSRQQSSQGSVFYVKLCEAVPDTFKQRDYVLKVYKNTGSAGFGRELQVLKALLKRQIEEPSIFGFPKIISIIEGDENSEILMEALGPNVQSLLK